MLGRWFLITYIGILHSFRFKNFIVNSKDCDKDVCKEFMNTTINVRKEALEEEKRIAVRSREERWNAIRTRKTGGEVEFVKSEPKLRIPVILVK